MTDIAMNINFETLKNLVRVYKLNTQNNPRKTVTIYDEKMIETD